ncbi:hypothetical protein DAPPUDRAFT_322075 [Daphnia pulex]|uniref:Uncharacterized protein n=1 Tax=Daphnia pulex TaxID=6669 RepID=E9GUI3_DAPPU|nr:hypothetical protein DAPPUDRAFT_337179 [Daphnia pulex]EFX76837.1 hypothetical protein DAPPUDRAFT_322075 [Daphnia pulex]|eukprot:EFX62275.1 hypothetical protein DAPPUDRAFT_337179 [Daphnia pulex]
MWDPSAKDARFENISAIWKLEVNRRCPNTPIVLVGNKKDLRNDAVTITELEEGKCRWKQNRLKLSGPRLAQLRTWNVLL